ncbi:hypothetical protein HDZ31DRAFT_80303 [Schizophyllum fasciatum]
MSTRSSYAASANPPRKAKRARLGNPPDGPHSSVERHSPSPHPHFILPKPLAASPVDTAPATTLPPVKRGRKPSGVSRASREAQRKLNHSIIEKARRTKINEALSTLSSLIPADYDNRAEDAENDARDGAEDSGDDDGDYVDRKQQAGKRGQGAPKKEKEFKLEILVKTVAYMQDLIQRVAGLEAEVKSLTSAPLPSPTCSACGARTTAKRKREGDHEMSPELASDALALPKLPSISEMLPDRRREDADVASYLPSPPSSAKFPARGRSDDSLDIPPPLSLGPTLQAAATGSKASPAAPSYTTMPDRATISPSLSPLLSPEDESAASLLLNMRTSSTRIGPSSSTSLAARGRRKEIFGVADTGSMPTVHAVAHEPSRGGGGIARPVSLVGGDLRLQKQTPSSLLGIVL